jgi:hypothetical protein
MEKRIWDASDAQRVNSMLESPEYSVPVLGQFSRRDVDYMFAILTSENANKEGRRGQ